MDSTINKPISPYQYNEYSDLKKLLESKILIPVEETTPTSPTPYPVFSYKMQPAKHWKWGKAYPKRKSVTLFDVNEYHQLIQVKISIPQRTEEKEVCPQLETFEKYSEDALYMMYKDYLNVKMTKKDFDTKYALKNKSSEEIMAYMKLYFQRPLMHPGHSIRHIWLVENEYRQRRILFVLGYCEKAWRLFQTIVDADYDLVSEQLFQFLNSHPDFTLDQMEGQLFICINFAEGLEEAISRKFASNRQKIVLIRDSMQIFVMLENLQRSSQSYYLTGKIQDFASNLKEDYMDTYPLADTTLQYRNPARQKENLLNYYHAFTHFLNRMLEQYPEERVFQKKAWQYLRVFSHISEQELIMQLYFKQYAEPIPFYLYEISAKLVSRCGFGVDRMAMLFKKYSVLDDRKVRKQSSTLSSTSAIISMFHLTLPTTSSVEYSTTYYEEAMDVIAHVNQKMMAAEKPTRQKEADS